MHSLRYGSKEEQIELTFYLSGLVVETLKLRELVSLKFGYKIVSLTLVSLKFGYKIDSLKLVSLKLCK